MKKKPRSGGAKTVSPKNRGGCPRRILMVDPDEILTMMFKNKLMKFGYTVDILTDGTVAVRRMMARSYCLLITEILLGDTDGYDLLRIISEGRGVRRPKKILVLTSLAENFKEDAEAAAQLGVESFMAKSRCTPEEVIEKVRLFTGMVYP